MTYDEAIGLLPDGEDIHTFLSGDDVLFGCDWPRPEILHAIRTSPVVKLAGPLARSMGHGLVIYTDVSEDGLRGRALFVATATEKVDAFDLPAVSVNG